jgi:hypothetical protein
MFICFIFLSFRLNPLRVLVSYFLPPSPAPSTSSFSSYIFIFSSTNFPPTSASSTSSFSCSIFVFNPPYFFIPVYFSSFVFLRSRDSVVGIATGYGLDDGGVVVRVPVGSRIFSSPRCPNQLWGPPNLSNGYRGLFPRG